MARLARPNSRPIAAEGDDELKAHLADALGDSHAQRLLGNRTENLERALEHYETALEFFISDGNVPKIVAILHNLAHVYQMLFEADGDVRHLHIAVECYQRVLDELDADEVSSTWNNLGLCHFQIAQLENDPDRLETAIGFFNESLQRATNRGAVLREANTLNSLANTYVALADYRDFEGNVDKALMLYQDSMNLATSDTDPMAYSLTRFNRGKLYREIAIRDRSRTQMDEAIAVLK